MASDKAIHDHISDLINEEHALRERLADGAITNDEENTRLHAIEVSLDQSWDLLRQRQARRHAGLDPDTAHTRAEDVVENYLD